MSAAEAGERNPFRPALIVGLVTAGLISFAAFIILIGWEAPRREAVRRSGAPPAVSAIGFAGIVQLTATVVPVRIVTSEVELDSSDLLVVPLWQSDDPERVRQLMQRRSGQATVLILPKWMVLPDPKRDDWVLAVGPWHAAAARHLLGRDIDLEPLGGGAGRRPSADTFGPLEGLALPMPGAPQVIHGDPIQMLAGVPGEGALVAQLGDEPHYVVADPDLLNNQALPLSGRARAAVEMLERLRPERGGTIRFATGGVRGVDAPQRRSLLRSLFEPPFLAMTIALLLAAFLAALHGLARFGPALRPARAIPFGKAALVQNSASLVRHAGREIRLGAGYADLVRDEAARSGGAPAHLQGSELETYLDRFTKPGELPFRSRAEAMRTARDRGELVAAARALFSWKKDIIR